MNQQEQLVYWSNAVSSSCQAVDFVILHFGSWHCNSPCWQLTQWFCDSSFWAPSGGSRRQPWTPRNNKPFSVREMTDGGCISEFQMRVPNDSRRSHFIGRRALSTENTPLSGKSRSSSSHMECRDLSCDKLMISDTGFLGNIRVRCMPEWDTRVSHISLFKFRNTDVFLQ